MVCLTGHFLEADTILVNSFEAVKPEVTMEIHQLKPGRPPVYPIGPLILPANSNNDTRRAWWSPRGPHRWRCWLTDPQEVS